MAIDSTVVCAHAHATGARQHRPKNIDPQRLAPAVLGAPAHLGGWGG